MFLESISAPFFSKPLQPEPYKSHWTTGIVYKLHSFTGSFLFLCSAFVILREMLGNHIYCIQDSNHEVGSKVSEDAFNSYCYISSTFSLPPENIRKQFESSNYAHIGVGPLGANNKKYEDDVTYHNYYQWVGYLLFIQSLSFFAPTLLHRFFQDGRIQILLANLNNVIMFPEYRDDKYGEIDFYFNDWNNHQSWWAIKLTLVDSLNFFNVVINVFVINWYLGHEFMSYGPVSLNYIFTAYEERGPDPFDVIFPKLSKCTLNTFGPSGTIQNHDALCVLPINIINEKIYFLLWFLLIPLTMFTIIHHMVAFIVLAYRSLRKRYLMLYISPKKPETKIKLSNLLDMTGFGDWMMFYLIARNTDRVVFGEFVDQIKYPDFNRDLDIRDEENQEMLKSRERKLGRKYIRSKERVEKTENMEMI